MADKTTNLFNPAENAWRRGWEEYRKWVNDYISTWVLAFILPAVTAIVIEVIYVQSSPLTTTVISLASGVAGLAFLFLISLIWHLVSGLKQQRNEARREILSVSAKLQDKINALNTSIKELIELEGRHKNLIDTYQPIKDLSSIKSGDVIKAKRFNISFMFTQMNTSVVSNVTFENCIFLGPAVISLLGTNSELSGYSFSGAGTFDNIVVKEEPGKGYRGMCAFLNCKIRNCKFENIGILGDDTLKNKMKEGKSIP